MSLFCLQQICFSYGGPDVLKDINLEIAQGDFIALLGPNGAGKSSLLRILAGLNTPTRGKALLNNIPIHAMSPRQRAQTIALVPQWTLMAFPFSVIEIVLMGRHPHLGAFAFESPRDLEIVMQAMQSTDVEKYQNRFFGELSGGEMQRVILARALAQEASIMLLDEPTAALDLHHQERIYRLLRQINASGKTIVVSTHDLNLAALYCDRFVLLEAGQIAAQGKAQEVITQANIQKIYRTPVEFIQRHNRPIIIPKLQSKDEA